MEKGLKIIGMVVGIVIILVFIFFMVEEKETNVNNNGITIQLETAMTINESSKEIYTLNQKETYQILNIIDNLTYTKETCDGLPKYYIKYNTDNEKGVLTYGIEEFRNGYHITFFDKGEAVLSENQNEELRKIINKYFN